LVFAFWFILFQFFQGGFFTIWSGFSFPLAIILIFDFPWLLFGDYYYLDFLVSVKFFPVYSGNQPGFLLLDIAILFYFSFFRLLVRFLSSKFRISTRFRIGIFSSRFSFFNFPIYIRQNFFPYWGIFLVRFFLAKFGFFYSKRIPFCSVKLTLSGGLPFLFFSHRFTLFPLGFHGESRGRLFLGF